MEYIYRMSRKMFLETCEDARKDKMSVEKYVTVNFGLLGECVKVEIIG